MAKMIFYLHKMIYFYILQDMKNTESFFKYLTISKHDALWGLNITDGGYSKIHQKQPYPPKRHPDAYHLEWSKGRRIAEYQIIYITRGQGIFESEHIKTRKINEGDIIFLFPGIWHRYMPEQKTGWDEYWVGFTGPVIQNIIANKFFDPCSPVFSIGYQQNLLLLFKQLVTNIKEEKPGHQEILAGITYYLLGLIYSLARHSSFRGKMIEKKMDKALFIMREHWNKGLDFKQIASELNMSYAWFRKSFKMYTGMSPLQYQLQLKLNAAKNLLLDHDKQIKNIAYSCGFESNYYFTRYFKRSTGLTPTEFRTKHKA